ncbi:DNA repair ATPase [Pseudomonadota bacterium]
MAQEQSASIVDNAVAEGGAYEVIRKRLVDQGQRLNQLTQKLNSDRTDEFGSTEMKVAARIRVRSENNCVARDIVQIGGNLLFGYNVFIGLKKETKISDVFSLFRVDGEEGNYEIAPVLEEGTFLADPGFRNDFIELYRYYKHTHLVELTVKNGKLLAGFQIGERREDIRVFQWSVSADGSEIIYIDNRGEREIQLPPAYDFEWIETGREDAVNGRHPHVNILDQVFVETLGGNLTIKVENNTESGLGIYSDPVEDKTQSLDDAEISYAEIGSLILIRVLPYRETDYRYLVFNTLSQEVQRIDAIGESCVQLPEDHGIIFPGGYYLQTGEYKTFDEEVSGLKFKRMIRSPNGEDVLYVFYEPDEGVVALFAYNLISKELQNPIYGHGYALAEDGTIVIFSAESEPTRVHPMQVWQTPYVSQEFASNAAPSQTFLGRIGNAELVRGISDLYSICRIIKDQEVSARLYDELAKTARKMFDSYYWIQETELKETGTLLHDIADTAELVIDEFEKVESIRQQSVKTMAEAEQTQQEILRSIQPDSWQEAEEYAEALNRLRHQRGHLTTIKEYRYIDLKRIGALDEALVNAQESLSEKTAAFLATEEALTPYLSKIDNLNGEVEKANTVTTLQPLIETIESTASGLDLLSELMATLKVGDATQRTRIIDAISEVYAKLNQSKATAKHKQKSLGSEEAVAQFSAQFKLFSQSINNALGLATTPERCDEQLSRLLIQLEELESQFSDFDQFLADIMSKREEVYESFETHKQQLLDERQRKAQSVADAADRILANIERRSMKFTEADELNTYFASDPLVLKIRELVERLRDLDSAVKADDIESRFKSSQEQATRALRDKSDIYEDGGQIIKLGPRHKFSVNTQELDLTIIPRNEALNLHLTGTDFYTEIEDPALNALSDYWEITLESETPQVYRAEYLAVQVLEAAETNQENLSLEQLRLSLSAEDELVKIVRTFASPRYKEGYEKGVHDHDAALILKQLLPALERADLLRYDPLSRGLAQIFWANLKRSLDNNHSFKFAHETWGERAQSAYQMHQAFEQTHGIELLVDEIEASLNIFIEHHPITVSALDINRAANYLVAELGRDRAAFIGSRYARELADELKRSLSDDAWRKYRTSLERLKGKVALRWELTTAWLKALVTKKELHTLERYIPEAVALINGDDRIDRRPTEVDVELTVTGLLGNHASITNQTLQFALDSFLQRLEHHKQNVIPAYHRYLEARQEIITRERDLLRLEEFKARPLSSFVRNRLINDAYLPIIGDNLAKQMGTVGENRRTDLMGLLMMISPPGYGKTTLMEYVANRLGLIFMKINCPSLGHDVLSLDPAQAPNATAKQELRKLNLALEMGNNVMLYLDDIQHTHPEFLQKFISLCDGTRRIEGVWKDKTKTYDMRGRKFCVVMAGNPYTESGEMFKVPDMLANRADIYNLGDILGGMDEQFASSYIENCLTSNAVLAPMATREMSDVYKLMEMARGENIAATDLSHQYSGAEVNEITGVLAKLFAVQEIVLKVNQQYIASAAQDDKYRTEPSFKLQGSYRNMNKMAEKISAVMNQQELMQMISDHYLGEAQLLTSGAEENLLKLAHLRGNQTDEEAQRWQQIRDDFKRSKMIGGDDADTGSQIVGQLYDLSNNIDGIGKLLEESLKTDTTKDESESEPALGKQVIAEIEKVSEALQNVSYNVEVVNEPVPGISKLLATLADTFEHSIHPLVQTMEGKLGLDLHNQKVMKYLFNEMRAMRKDVAAITKASGKVEAKKSNDEGSNGTP